MRSWAVSGRLLVVKDLASVPEVTSMHFAKSVTRHVALGLFRLLLAFGVVWSMPLAHMCLGGTYPGDGQQASGFIVVFFLVGFGAVALFVCLGSIMQVLLRNRAARHTILIDAGLFLLLAGVLVYGGVTAKYTDTSSTAVVSTAPAAVSGLASNHAVTTAE